MMISIRNTKVLIYFRNEIVKKKNYCTILYIVIYCFWIYVKFGPEIRILALEVSMRRFDYLALVVFLIQFVSVNSYAGVLCGSDEDSVSAGKDSGAVTADDSRKGVGKVAFRYDVDFEMNFDNREYDAAEISESRTVFGARLTPSIGLSLKERKGGAHSLMLGIDVMKDFGDSPITPDISTDPNSPELAKSQVNKDLFREITLWYKYSFTAGKTDMDIIAGIFPRRFMTGNYSNAFFSDSLRFYDNNIEGLLLKFKRPSAKYEVGCDWMGMYGVDRRERFMIFSSGDAEITDLFSLGYSAYLYHYAGAEHVEGVVDNALLNPFFKLDFSSMTGLQRLDLRLGWLQSLQNDRRNIGKYTFPHGGEFTVAVRNWNAGIENYLFYGTSMMPYYRNKDAAGMTYGNLLYMGEPFYKVSLDNDGLGFYDRLEAYYEPRISDFLNLRIAAVLHFNDWAFSGWQQKVSLVFNLQSLLDRVSRKK